jgi:glycosyltransferase involved in cell wall biosynthesis
MFRGYVNDVCANLAQADLFVLPSIAEGNSNSILEAMAAGLPVVSTRVGGTPMLVGTAGARFLLEPGDRDALCARLTELIRGTDLRRQVGREMKKRIEMHFDILRVSSTYGQAYKLLATKQRDRMEQLRSPLLLAD